MARVLVTRPEPGASRTAAALTAAGHEAVVRPLMDTVAVAWTMPDGEFDAVLLTSAAAVRHLGGMAASVRELPTLCVGDATARAARAAGFWRAEAVGETVADVMTALALAAGLRRLLHLAGEDRTAFSAPEGLCVETRVVYRARLLALEEPGRLDAVMIFSERSGAHFAATWQQMGRARDLTVVAISDKAAAAVGGPWRKLVVAAAPNEASMLAALADEGL